jgi:hypothetical protein
VLLLRSIEASDRTTRAVRALAAQSVYLLLGLIVGLPVAGFGALLFSSGFYLPGASLIGLGGLSLLVLVIVAIRVSISEFIKSKVESVSRPGALRERPQRTGNPTERPTFD